MARVAAEPGAFFRSIGDAWCDATTPHGGSRFTVLGCLAELECELIWQWTSEARKRARRRQVRLAAITIYLPESGSAAPA
jgi:DNA invertase Pin-like site-specific DNA recombinase